MGPEPLAALFRRRRGTSGPWRPRGRVQRRGQPRQGGKSAKFSAVGVLFLRPRVWTTHAALSMFSQHACVQRISATRPLIGYATNYRCLRILKPTDKISPVFSHQCLEIIYRCGGHQGNARKMLKVLQRSWRARYPGAGLFAKETAKAKEIVERETAVRLAEAPPPSSSAATGSSSKGNRAVAAGGSCPIVEGSTTVTATTTRSAVAWGGGAAAVASRSSGSTGGSSSGGSSGSGGGGSSSRGGRGQGGRASTEMQESFWCRPLKSLAGGKFALDRQVEGGVSNSPPGTRGREKLSPDLNLSKPWSPREAEKFTRALLEEGSKNFYAVQVNNHQRTDSCSISRHALALLYAWDTPKSNSCLAVGPEQQFLISSCNRCNLFTG